MIVKNGRRLCGTGGALSNVPIIQNKAYFEVKVQANGNSTFYIVIMKSISIKQVTLKVDAIKN